MRTLILLCDKNGGMLFNHRRQTRDNILMRYIASVINHQMLYMTDYSMELFDDASIPIKRGRLDQAASDPDAWILIENPDDLIDKIWSIVDLLIVYRWDCEYPCDTKPLEIDTDFWILDDPVSYLDGSSHKHIAQEIYLGSYRLQK